MSHYFSEILDTGGRILAFQRVESPLSQTYMEKIVSLKKKKKTRVHTVLFITKSCRLQNASFGDMQVYQTMILPQNTSNTRINILHFGLFVLTRCDTDCLCHYSADFSSSGWHYCFLNTKVIIILLIFSCNLYRHFTRLIKFIIVFAGEVKRLNVCKRHGCLDTGF